jgi:hypothetical protein
VGELPGVGLVEATAILKRPFSAINILSIGNDNSTLQHFQE